MALREINLVPIEVVGRQRSIRCLFAWSGVLVAALLGVGAASAWSLHRASTGAASGQGLKQAYKDLGLAMADIGVAQTELDILDQQHALVRDLTARRPYADVLNALADLMAPSTWLTQLTMQPGGGESREVVLKLRGFCPSNAHVGALLNQLTAEPMFRGVELKSTREPQGPRAVQAIEFDIECVVASG